MPSPFDEAAFLTVDASGGIAPVISSENGAGKNYWSFSARELAFMEKGFHASHKHPALDALLKALPGGEARNYPAESLTMGHAVRGEPFVEIADAFADASLGYFYALCSHLVDMEEGSFMGLASYGRPGPLVDGMRDVIELLPEGRIRINKDAMHYWAGEYVLEDPVALRRLSTSFLKSFGPGRKFFDAITQRHMDFAYAAQKRLEEAMVHVAGQLHKSTGSDNLVIAGGVGLNSVANGVILRETPFKSVFIQPAASDDGLALGYALFGHYVLSDLPDTKFFSMDSAYLGPDRDAEAREFVASLEQGTLPVEYWDPLPFTESVDILWRGRGEGSERRTAMRRVGPHRHLAHLPIGPNGGVEYVFEAHASDPHGYAEVEVVHAPEPAPAPKPASADDPFGKFLIDHRDVAGVLDGERAFVGPEHVVIDPTNRCDNNCLACWTYSPLLGRYAPPEEWFKSR
ncbi:MAG: hypothetical protein M5R36_28430 [Deltaproteobacteria bacterium]|nr:hypothetical protein [Deltaproteobacteria bacterium]